MLALVGLRWLTVACRAVDTVVAWRPVRLGADRAVVVARRWAGWCCSARRAGSAIAAGGARLLLRGVRRAATRAAASVHLRLWAAERLAELSGADRASPARPGSARYARALGAKIGHDVDLHSAPPVTGLLKLGTRRGGRARGRPAPATGSTATSCTSARSGSAPAPGRRAQHAAARRPDRQGRRDRAPGRRCSARCPAGAALGGLAGAAGAAGAGAAGRAEPARRGRGAGWLGLRRHRDAARAAARRSPALPGAGAARRRRPPARRPWPRRCAARCWSLPLGDASPTCSRYALLVAGRRAAARHRPARRATTRCTAGSAWQVWATERLMDMARIGLFPLYASLFTPVVAAAARRRRSAATSRRRR